MKKSLHARIPIGSQAN